MKRFDIKIDTSKIEDAKPVQLQEWAIDESGTVLSGVCSPDVTVVKDGKCKISVNNGDYVAVSCKNDTVKRMGYITVDDQIIYIEDSFIQYEGSSITATYIKNDEGTKFDEMYVMIGGNRYDISDGQQNQWYNIQKLSISDNNPIILDVEDAVAIKNQEFVKINDHSYPLRQDISGYPYVIFDGETYYGYYQKLDQYEQSVIFDYEEIGLTGEYGVYKSEVVSLEPEFLKVYADNLSAVNLQDVVYITDNENSPKHYYVQFDDDNNPYIVYCGLKYPVSADMKVNAVIDGTEYLVAIDDKLTPDMYVGHLVDYPNIYISAFTSNGKIEEMYKRTIVTDGDDKYFSNEVIGFTSYSGIMYNGKVRIVEYEHKLSIDTFTDVPYIEMSDKYEGYFTVYNIDHDNRTLSLVPLANSDDENYIGEIEMNSMYYISQNYRNMSFIVLNTVFGVKITDDYIYNYPVEDIGIFLLPYIDTINFTIPLGNAVATNLDIEQRQEDLLEDRLWHYVNGNTDIERDIYSPVFYKYKKDISGNIELDDDGIAIIEDTLLMKKIKFNLHFRTRNLDDWSVNEDNVELQNDGISSWNCLDHYYNTKIQDDTTGDITFDNELRKTYADGIANCADLLYFLNFTNQDVFYQKTALAKSFIRLSFFDTPVPNEQSLLWTSTVFFDEGACYSKYLNNIENESYREFDNLYTGNTHAVSVKGEPVNETGGLTLDNDKRLCMEFPVENRLKTRVSSEGYYIYIYKEYAQYLHEKTIYMRVDFNHAKIGQSVPMMMLHHRDENNEETKYQANCSNDVFQARDGVKMENMLNYIYMPIKIVYNEKLGRYTYHFENIVPAEEEGDTLNINLFEVKYMDESK